VSSAVTDMTGPILDMRRPLWEDGMPTASRQAPSSGNGEAVKWGKGAGRSTAGPAWGAGMGNAE
jgi:hypothetical protein